MKYHKEIMDEITKKYNETNDEFNKVMVKAVKTHSNIYNQKIVSIIASFVISYGIQLIASPALVLTGLYNIALVRPLTILASVITTSIIVHNRHKDSEKEKFKEYMNSEIHTKRIEEEVKTEIAVANVKSKQAVLLNMASKVANEQDILTRIEEEYNITERKKEETKETFKKMTYLETEKQKYEEKLSIAIKQNVLSNHFSELLKKKNNKTIKYAFWGLFIGILIWNMPQSIANLFVESYQMDILSAFLSSILPPVALSIACGSIGNKSEKEDLYVFNKMNKELGDDSISSDLSLNTEEYEKEFDQIIDQLVDINLELTDDRFHLEHSKVADSNNFAQENYNKVEDKPMTLKLIKKN